MLQNEEVSSLDAVFVALASEPKALSESSRFLAYTHDPFAQEDAQERQPVSQEESDPLMTRRSNNGAASAEHVLSTPPNNPANSNPQNLAGAYAGAGQGPGGASTSNPSGGAPSSGGGSANLHLPSPTQVTQLQEGLSGATSQMASAAPTAPSNAALGTTQHAVPTVGSGSDTGSSGTGGVSIRSSPLLSGSGSGSNPLSWLGGTEPPTISPQWSQDIDYDPYVYNAPPSQVNTEGDNVSLQIQAGPPSDSDGDSDALSYAAINLPPGLSISTATGLISGTVAYGDAADFDGAYNATIIITDAETNSAALPLSWTINPAQIAPVLTNPSDQTNLRGDNVSLQMSATQIDNNPITYSASNLPSGLSIDSETGLISGTVDPSATLGVPYAVTVTATDDTTNLSASQSFNWIINATNVAPVLTNPANQTNSAGDYVSLQLSATDADGDALTYTATGLPPGLSLDPISGVISGTLPNNAASNTPYNVTVTASDGMASSSQSCTWTVNAVSLPNPGDQSNLDGNSVSLQLAASDANNAALIYSANGLPSGLSINSSTGLISGTIASNADTNSPYSVTVTATDSNNDSVSQSFTWTVARLAVNNPGDQEIQEGTSVSLQLSATDHEGTPTYSATGLPPGLSISSTGLISGTVGIGSYGSSPYQVTVTVTDGSNTSSQSFVWTVTPRVALVNPGPQSNAEGDSVSLQLSATSPGGTMQLSASGLPSGLSINSSTGLISGTVASGDSSSSPYTVTVTANDGTSSSSQTFSWAVSVINLVSPGDQTNNDGDTVSLSLTTGYHGSGTLSYSATGLPPGLSINSSTGQITGTISGTADTNSPYSVTVTVTDGTNTSSQSFDWAVNAVVAIDSIDDQSNAAGDTVSLQVSASDTLNNTLTYSATNLPTGLSIASTTGLISGTIAVGADGSSPYAVTVTATDSAGNSASQSFTWTVTHVALVNPGPQWSVDGQAIAMPLQGGDADGDTVSYTASGLPSGLSISSSGLISGTIAPNADTNSPYNVTVSASDGANTTTQTFLWTVSQVALTLPSDQTNSEGDNVSLQLQGTASSGSLIYNASGLPPGLSLNATTGLISGAIAAGAAANGPYTVDVSVSNGTVSTSQSFTWTVNPVVNLTVPADQSNNVGDSVSLQVSASDALNNTLTYSATGLPSGLSINSSTGLISGTITAGDASGGPYVVTVSAADGTYSSSAIFNWNVTDTAALTLTVPGTQVNVASDSVVNVRASASDPDGDAVSYSATNLPDGLTIDPSTGLISGTIAEDAADPAPYQTTVTASDGNGQSVSQSFTWIVNAPPIIAQASPLSFVEGVDPGSFAIATFTTPDMDSLPDDFAALIDYGDGTTDTGAISGGNGSFIVTADHVYAEAGSYPVSILIFNGLTGASTTTTTTATVADGALTLTGGFQEGDPGNDLQGSFIVGYLTDQNPDATTSDFTETISDSAGNVLVSNSYVSYLEQVGPGRFLVVYPQDYSYSFPNTNLLNYTVSVTVTDVDGASASTTSNIILGNLTADVPVVDEFASQGGDWVFQDQNENATASDFTAQLNWGDGTISPCTVIAAGGGDVGGSDNDGDGSSDNDNDPLQFAIVVPPHTYTQDSYDQPNGQYQLTMTVTDTSGDVLTGIQYASVVRPPLLQYTANVVIPPNLTVSNAPVAVFTVPDGADPVSEFTAQINWGDGTGSSSGTIQELAPGLYQVVGSHTYAAYDWYTMTVTISQGWGGMAPADDGGGQDGRTPIVAFTDKDFNITHTLKVATWIDSFVRENPGKYPVVNKLAGNFTRLDPYAFDVFVKDPIAAKDDQNIIGAHISTSSDPAGEDIRLQVTNKGKGYYRAIYWQILVSNTVDDKEAGTRGHLVKLGDEVRVTNLKGVIYKANVPVQKEVKLHIAIVKDQKGAGGKAPITVAQVQSDVDWANKIYAPAGVVFKLEGPIQTIDPPINISNGVNEGEGNTLSRQEKAILGLRTPNTKDIWVFYVNQLNDANGQYEGGIRGTGGVSFRPGTLSKEDQKYANSIIINSRYVLTEKPYRYTTLSHEIGHIVMVGPADAGPTGHPNGDFGPTQIQLMAKPDKVKGEVNDSRRITPRWINVILSNKSGVVLPPS